MLRTLLVYVVLGFGWQYASKQNVSSTPAGNNQTEGKQTVVPPAVQVVNPTVSTPPGEPQTPDQTGQTKDKTHWVFRPEWMIVWVTLLYTFTAWLTLRAIKRQAKTMEMQVKDAQDAANAAAETTKATLEAIQRQAKELSRQNKNMISKERARIAVKIVRIDTLDFYDTNVVKVQIENFEPTHALNVRAIGGARPVIKDMEEPNWFTDDLVFPVEKVIRANSAPSEGTMYFFFPEELPSEISPADLAVRIEARGSIEYDDVFGQPHVTPFSYLMNIPKTSHLPKSNLFKVHPFSQWRESEDPEENRAT
jgi:hypothetical protein